MCVFIPVCCLNVHVLSIYMHHVLVFVLWVFFYACAMRMCLQVAVYVVNTLLYEYRPSYGRVFCVCVKCACLSMYLWNVCM